MYDGEWVEEWADVESDEREARAEARAIQRHAQAQAWEDRHTGMQLEPFYSKTADDKKDHNEESIC
jgi:hypothetical protein